MKVDATHWYSRRGMHSAPHVALIGYYNNKITVHAASTYNYTKYFIIWVLKCVTSHISHCPQLFWCADNKKKSHRAASYNSSPNQKHYRILKWLNKMSSNAEKMDRKHMNARNTSVYAQGERGRAFLLATGQTKSGHVPTTKVFTAWNLITERQTECTNKGAGVPRNYQNICATKAVHARAGLNVKFGATKNKKNARRRQRLWAKRVLSVCGWLEQWEPSGAETNYPKNKTR